MPVMLLDQCPLSGKENKTAKDIAHNLLGQLEELGDGLVNESIDPIAYILRVVRVVNSASYSARNVDS